MSLVNEMLRNLQHREVVAESPLAGLQPVSGQPAKSRRAAVIVAVSVAGLTVGVTTVIWSHADGVDDAAMAIVEIPAVVSEPARVASDSASSTEASVAQLASFGRYTLDYRLSRIPERRAAGVTAVSRAPTAGPAVVSDMQVAETVAPVVDTPSDAKPFAKTPVDPVQRLQRMALSALRAGRPREAELHIRDLLTADPTRTDSYLLLHRALVSQSRVPAARDVLSGALEQVAEPARIAQVLAFELLNDGRTRHAQGVLVAHRPAGRHDLDYEALLAAVYERNGHYEQAAELYRYLVGQRPDDGTWWVGLAISEAALDRKDAAVQAFRHARDMRGLDPKLTQYVAQRLDQLEAGI